MAKPEAIALVLLPPPELRALIDPLRAGNDKSWNRGWTAHITILFPFDIHHNLDAVVQKLQTALWGNSAIQPFQVTLSKLSHFATRDYETVVFAPEDGAPICALWSECAEALGHPIEDRGFTPHMTIGQAARNSDSIAFLDGKGKRLLSQVCGFIAFVTGSCSSSFSTTSVGRQTVWPCFVETTKKVE